MAAFSAIAAGVGAAASVGSTVKGMVDSSKDRKKAEAAYQRAMEKINAVGAPPDLSARIFMEEFKSAGVLTPQMEQDLGKMETAFKDVKEDPKLRQAQVTALEQMQAQGRVGLTAKDKAALNQVRQSTQRDLEAKRQQIIQSAQARGQSGSGAELQAQLLASQAGADQASAEADRVAAMSQEAALQARMNALRAAGDVRGQDYQVASALAQAKDRMAEANMANAIGRQQRNIDRSNVAQATNLQNAQRLLDVNTAMRNQESLRANEARRTFWQDRLDQAKASAGMDQGEGQRRQDSAATSAQNWAKIGSAAMDIGTKVAGTDWAKNTKIFGSDDTVDTQDTMGEYDFAKKKSSIA